jgi:hypothetical protein
MLISRPAAVPLLLSRMPYVPASISCQWMSARAGPLAKVENQTDVRCPDHVASRGDHEDRGKNIEIESRLARVIDRCAT